MFTALFLAAFLLTWTFLAFLPWLGWSVATRGRAGLWSLPLCVTAGVVAALAVPLLGATGWGGIWLSFAAAFMVPLALLAIRRWAVPRVPAQTPTASARRT